MIDKYGTEIFGLAGALVSLSFIEKLTILGAVLAVISGVGCSVVGAPILTHYLNPPPTIRDHVNAGFGLILGVSGFMLAGAVHASAKAVRDWLPESIKRYIDRRIDK